MKCEIRYSPEAVRDLDQIWEYITMELCNVDAAYNVVESIMDIIDKLADFPKMGSRLDAVIDVEDDYRFVMAGNYMAFYHLGSKEIFIDRVLYGRRDYMKVLFGNK